MGTPKAGLEWHGSTLVRRVAGVLARSVGGPVVVVSAAGQELPELPDGVEVAFDERPGRGPLQGLAAGLRAVADRAGIAYVSSVDVPLLHPAFVRVVLAGPADWVDVAVPEVGGRVHPLAAAYRVGVRDVVEELLSEDRLALRALLDRCRVRRLAAPELAALESLTNLNSRADYERALALPGPSVRVNGTLVRAWTVGDVVSAAGADQLVLNGEPVRSDPELPLVEGDVLTF